MNIIVDTISTDGEDLTVDAPESWKPVEENDTLDEKLAAERPDVDTPETEVTDEDVYSIVSLTLRHRLRKDPMATIDEGDKVIEVFSSVFGYDQEEE